MQTHFSSVGMLCVTTRGAVMMASGHSFYRITIQLLRVSKAGVCGGGHIVCPIRFLKK